MERYYKRTDDLIQHKRLLICCVCGEVCDDEFLLVRCFSYKCEKCLYKPDIRSNECVQTKTIKK